LKIDPFAIGINAGPKDDNPYSFFKEQQKTILQTNPYLLLCQEEKILKPKNFLNPKF
jgi:hypothetical protein